MWRRNGWGNPVASAGLRQARTRPAAPGPHQARARPQSNFGSARFGTVTRAYGDMAWALVSGATFRRFKRILEHGGHLDRFSAENERIWRSRQHI